MVVKKTSRTPKSTAPDPITPVENAGVQGAPRPRPAVKRAAPKADAAANGAKPRVARAKRPLSSTAAKAVPSQVNGEPKPTAEATPVMVARAVTDEDIRVRAYFLSLEHRGQGSAEYFWRLAEQELRGLSR